jgi:hypothetical protein
MVLSVFLTCFGHLNMVIPTPRNAMDGPLAVFFFSGT